MGNDSSPGSDVGLRLLVSSVASVGVFAGVMFWPAGRWSWPAGWAYLALFTLYILATTAYLLRVNPEVVVHRMRLAPGTKRWDAVWAVVFGPFFLATYVVAGLDAVRYGWSEMPVACWPVGLALFVAGSAVLDASMAVNPFFEKTVRIQTERGQYVIDTGPYRFVRHPGYAGFAGWCLATPLLLLSWWAFLPALLCVAGLVIRTALEDRTLRGELAGYEDYARRVRHRLVPGLW